MSIFKNINVWSVFEFRPKLLVPLRYVTGVDSEMELGSSFGNGHTNKWNIVDIISDRKKLR